MSASAWGFIGTDHEGEATPGEVYLFGVARQARAVSAALASWRRVEEDAGVTRIGCKPGAPWARIKRIARWKSQALEQYARRAPKESHGVGFDMRITVGDCEITGHRGDWAVVDDPVPPRPVSTPFRTPGLFGRLARRMSFEDESTLLDALREMQRMTLAEVRGGAA